MEERQDRITWKSILTLLLVPIIAWAFSFILTVYSTEAEVTNMKSDIQEIKQDVKFLVQREMEKSK